MTTARAPKKPSKLTKRILLAAATLGISLALAEVLYRFLKPAPFVPPEIWSSDGERIPTSEIANFLRTSDDGSTDQPHPRGTLKPGLAFRQFYDRPTLPYFDEDGCISALINDLGFRDLPFELAKQPGELRLLAVGDSFTFGSGVQTEDTWSQALEGMLRGERRGPVEVINGGFAAGSHHTEGYVNWIKSDGLDFQPDILVIGFCLNDLGPVPMLSYPTKHQERPWLGGVSEILNAIQANLVLREAKNHQQPREAITEYFKIQHAESLQRAMEALTAIHKACQQRQVRMLVAVFPMLTQLKIYPLGGLHKLVTEHCAEEGIEAVDLASKFLGREDGELWVHPTDQHPNDVGHQLIAEGIHDYLKANPSPPKPR
jgi:lysophospholipase L1-like esterase